MYSVASTPALESPNVDGPFADDQQSPYTPSTRSFAARPYGMLSSTSGLSRRRFQAAFRSRRVREEDMASYVPYHKTPNGRKTLRRAYWIFLGCMMIGVFGAGALLATTYLAAPKHKYCLVLNEQFDGTEIDTSIWQHEVQLGGFGNHEFEMTTASSTNSYIDNGQLVIVPTLTSDVYGEEAVVNGHILNFTSDGTCTSTTKSDCQIFSNNTIGNISVLPPIMSARLTTKLSRSIKYGRVEVSAKMPTGDWIWPAIWMMPRDSVYGDWPASGEIDIVESKGNKVTSNLQDNGNAVRSSLHWGPGTGLDRYELTTQINRRRHDYYTAKSFTFGMDWDSKGLFTWRGTRARNILQTKFNKPFWNRGNFGVATSGGTTYSDPWTESNNTNAAPFDQDFFLILNVAVGGTNGYFPDESGKPWSNDGLHPAADFWGARKNWEKSWPTDPKERGMVIDYVKMWRIAEPGEVCEA